MEKCVAFLRGVNMAGHNKIIMADLKKLFVSLGYKDAETYIQSGNIVFSDSGELPEAIESKIENAIRKKLGLEIAALVRTADDLSVILRANPYINSSGSDHAKIAALLLKDMPTDSQISKMDGIAYPPDEYFISGKEIFIHCPDGFGRTKLYTNFFEKKMKVIGTARNWNSMTVLWGMANTH
jgi:uncharacterized protein (DUF1697 family)